MEAVNVARPSGLYVVVGSCDACRYSICAAGSDSSTSTVSNPNGCCIACATMAFTLCRQARSADCLMPIGPERRKPPRQHRPNSTRRGYGYKWQKYARGFLSRNPFCVACESLGRDTAAECVDHIMPVTGPADPVFWTPKNHQPLCWKCHGRKTVSDNK